MNRGHSPTRPSPTEEPLLSDSQHRSSRGPRPRIDPGLPIGAALPTTRRRAGPQRRDGQQTGWVLLLPVQRQAPGADLLHGRLGLLGQLRPLLAAGAGGGLDGRGGEGRPTPAKSGRRCGGGGGDGRAPLAVVGVVAAGGVVGYEESAPVGLWGEEEFVISG